MLAGVFGFTGVALSLLAQETTRDQSVATPSAATIGVGDNIKEAQKILNGHGIANGQTLFSLANVPEDEDYITANIEPAHMTLCIWYSKANHKVIRMQVLISPWPRQGKAYDTWLDVTSYQINQDGTFVLTFPKPPTVLEIEERRKSAREKSEAPTWNFGKSRSTNRRRITPVD